MVDSQLYKLIMKTDNEKYLAIKLGKAICKTRKAAGMSQEKLGERLGIGLEAMSRMERGLVTPSLYRLFQIADVFECSVSRFILEISPTSHDQVSHIYQMIQYLSPGDRELIIENVQTLANRLASKK